MPTAERISLIRWIGVWIFLASFALPGGDWHDGDVRFSFEDAGVSMFLVAPFYIIRLIFQLNSPSFFILGLFSAAAWLCNFTVFVKLKRQVAWIPLVTLWAWVLCVARVYPYDHLHAGLLGYLPMYPWLIGLTVLNASLLLTEPTDRSSRREPRH